MLRSERLDLPEAILRCVASGGKLGRVDDGDAGFGEFGVDGGDGAIEVDGAAGVAQDERVEAEAARVESGVADAIVVGKAGKEDAREAALAQIAGKASGRGAVVLKECRIGINLRAEAFAQDQLGSRELRARDGTPRLACLARNAQARVSACRRRAAMES